MSGSEVPLERDPLGRLRLRGGPFGLAVCGDAGRLTLALVRGCSVALSLHEVPRSAQFGPAMPFTEGERRWAHAAAEGRRAERLARLWTRKEAALRLLGSPLSVAGELDALASDGPGGALVRRPERAAWSAPVGSPEEAHVRNLEAEPGLAAAAATSAPVARVRTWHVDVAACAEDDDLVGEPRPGRSAGDDRSAPGGAAPLLSTVW
ncbi:4'-phosphopantetheinyl transferase superfamily protein [Streptomyces sp. R11]|uniref:4'-phosphopantetheinyl transferase superfamily protein n=1 Tax=Streptomyces sp. R11 TaxID=3238625 RepID=A0AB39N654_9ACTN